MQYEQLKYLPFFRNMDAGLLQNIASHVMLKYYNRGEILFTHGDDIEYFYVVNFGWVKLFRDTSDGQEALLGLGKSGDLIGEVNIDKKCHLCSAEIVNDTQALLLPHKVLINKIKDNGLLGLAIIKALNSTINMLGIQLEHSSTMKSAQRIGCFLLRMCGGNKGEIKISLPYEKTLLASYLGMKRETFSRGLKELKKLGVKVDGHMLYIYNVDELIKFCCVSCSLNYDSCS